jgi:hypothetical protein
MKTSYNVYFVQENTNFEYQLSFKADGKFDGKNDAERVICGGLHKFYKFVETLKLCNGKGVSLAKPFSLMLTRGDGEVVQFDGTEVREELKATLKLQNTNASRRRFAGKALQIFRLYQTELKLQTLDELLTALQD